MTTATRGNPRPTPPFSSLRTLHPGTSRFPAPPLSPLPQRQRCAATRPRLDSTINSEDRRGPAVRRRPRWRPMPVIAARGRRPLWVLAAAAPEPAVAAAPIPAPTAVSFPPVSAPPRSWPPYVAPRSMAPVDYAASAAVAAPALCVACLHAVTVRRPPRSEGGTRAAATSAGGVVRPRLASAAAAGAANGLPSMAA